MNADSGRVHVLDGVLKSDTALLPGQPLDGDMLAEVDELKGEAKERLEALQEELAAGAPIVGVSEEVVQRQALGERELERRGKRRRMGTTPEPPDPPKGAPPGPPNPPTPPHHRPVG